MIAFEQRLKESFLGGLKEASMHFEGGGPVHRSLLRVTQRLHVLGIPYAIVGGMALYAHGFERFTQDVDLLVTREGLQRIHEQLEGLGWLPLFAGSKNLRDTETGVRIEFLVSGEYPGDGKPKPVAFPDPREASVDLEGVRVLDLPRLVELKLASGLSAPHRGQDLIDVQRLIQSRRLPVELADQLDPSVREKYRELWTIVQNIPQEEQ